MIVAPQDVAHLRAAMEDLAAACGTGDLSAMVLADTAFHNALTAAAGNRVLSYLMNSIMAFLVDSRRISLSVAGRGPHVLSRHREVLASIEQHDVVRTLAAVRAHVHDLHRDLRVATTASPAPERSPGRLAWHPARQAERW